MATTEIVKIAVTQHEPVWLDLQGTVDKTVRIVKQAADAGAKLVAFPECWVPGEHAFNDLTLLLSAFEFETVGRRVGVADTGVLTSDMDRISGVDLVFKQSLI